MDSGGGARIGGNATDDKTENWVNYSASTTGDNNIINKINPADASKTGYYNSGI